MAVNVKIDGDVTGLVAATNKGSSSLKDLGNSARVTSAELAKVTSGANKGQTAFGSLGQKTNDLNKQTLNLGAALKTAGVAFAAVTGAAMLAGKAYNQTVSAVIEYNKSILDASRATRMGVEDMSRFVQVGDDMGVGIDSITTALQMATKNGFAPSIDAIARLADKTNAMSSPTEKAAALAKIFGKNWAELNPILELGGARIRELAASQADGLVVTEAEIRKSEKLRLQIDTLTDSWTAYKNELALNVIPAITGYLDSATKQAEISGILQRAGELNIASYTDQSYALTRMAMDDMSYVDAIRAELAAHDANTAAMMKSLGPVEAIRVANLGVASSAGQAESAIKSLTSTELLRQVAEAIMAGDNQGAKALYDTYLQAKKAEDSIAAVISGLMKLNGMRSTAYINIVSSGASPQSFGSNPNGAPTGGGSITGYGGSYSNATVSNGYIYVNGKNTGDKVKPKAIGGIATPGLHMVGEEGPELIQTDNRGHINVLRAGVTRALSKGAGVMPHAMTDPTGGGSGGGYKYTPSLKLKPSWWGSKNIQDKPGYSGSVFDTTGGGGGSSATQQTQATAAQAVAEAAAAAIPQAVAQGTRVQAEAITRMVSDNAKANMANTKLLNRIADILMMQGTATDIGNRVAGAMQTVDLGY